MLKVWCAIPVSHHISVMSHHISVMSHHISVMSHYISVMSFHISLMSHHISVMSHYITVKSQHISLMSHHISITSHDISIMSHEISMMSHHISIKSRHIFNITSSVLFFCQTHILLSPKQNCPVQSILDWMGSGQQWALWDISDTEDLNWPLYPGMQPLALDITDLEHGQCWALNVRDNDYTVQCTYTQELCTVLSTAQIFHLLAVCFESEKKKKSIFFSQKIRYCNYSFVLCGNSMCQATEELYSTVYT